MSDNRKPSPEVQKFMRDLEKQKITMTVIEPNETDNFDDDFEEEKERNPVLLFLSKILFKLMTFIAVILTLLGFANVYGVYMIYQSYKAAGGLMGIVETKWTFFLLGYIVVMVVFNKIHLAIGKYSKGY